MKINNPRLVLTFSEPYTSSQTITYQSIVYHSIKIKYQLLNGLKASSNQVSLQLTKDCSAVEKIIAAEKDIQAVLYNDSAVLFTGFISTNFTWNVTDNGEQALNITIEDVGTRLFSKPFIVSGYHMFNCSVSNAVQAICERAGVTVSEDCILVTSPIAKTVDSSKSCRDIIEQLLYEVGYVYYFDNLGELRLFKIDCSSTAGAPVWDKNVLYTKGNKALSLTKKLRQYRYARVTYTELGTASNYLIYRNTTGKDSSHPYCNFSLKQGEHFDGTEVYSASEWQEETADEFREPALLEACNAESETIKVGSNKIISVSNVSAQVQKDTGLTCTIVSVGGPYLQIDAHNPVSGEKFFTRMDAYGDIVFEKSINIIRTDTGSSADNIINETVEYIHTKALVQSHANLLSQYHQYCNSQYTFYSTTDISCGSVIKLNDNLYSGLNTFVLITGKTVSDSNDIIQYSAIGISVFDLNKEAFHRATDKGKANTRGADGASGAKGEKGDKGDTGEQGPQGEKGADGAKGDKGDTGAQGPKGDTGAKGETGAQGPKGDTGAKGETGAQGPQGEKGLDGAKGDKGDKGDTGATGSQGPKGDTGSQGPKGETGATGNGISSIAYYYKATSNQIAPSPSEVTSTSIPTLSSTNKYLWQKEVITYTNGTDKTTVALIGTYGDTGSKGEKGDTGNQGPKGETGATGSQGPKGDTGATGNGISSISYYYKATTNQTQPSPSDVTSTTLPSLSATNKFLWQKEVISYTNGTNKTTVALIGTYGDTGSKGDTGSQGPKGDKGDTGSQGPKGDTGATGSQGPKGDKGDTGAQGPQGATGAKGDKGDTGATGLGYKFFGERSWNQSQVNSYTQIGYSDTWNQTVSVATVTGDTIYLNVNNTTTGQKGVLYLLVTSGASASANPTAKVVSYVKDGEKGAKGDTGSQGPQGVKGDTGAQGPQGPTGATGAKGDPAWTYVTLTTGYDLNNCFAKDTIYVSTSTAICNSLLNKPSGFIAGEVRIETQWCGSDSYVVQNLYCRNSTNHKAFTRTKYGTTYGAWAELGAKGDKGDKGDTGSQGPKGDKGEDVGRYLGAITTTSQISGLTPNTGDGILIASSTVSGYNIGSPYIWNGSAWIEQTGITPDNTSMLFAMLNDARSIDSGVMSWFSDIVSANASIHSIFSQEITMTGSGIIKSKNYSEDSSGSPTRGYKLIGAEDLIKAKGIRVVDMVASGDSVLMGSIVHPFLKTQKAVPSQSAISYTETASYFNRKTLVADFTAKAKQYGSYEVFLGQHVAAGNTYKYYGYVFTGTVVYRGTTFTGIVVPIRDNYKEFTALLADGYSEGNGWSSYLGRAAQSPQTNYPNHVMIGNFAAEKMKDTYVLTSDTIGNYSAVFGGTTYTQRSYSQFYKPTQSMINAFSVIPVGASSLVSGGTARIGSSTFTSPFYISKGSASLMLYDSSKSVNLEVDAEYYTQLVFSSIVLASGIDGIIVGNIEPDISGRNIGNNTPFNVVKANKVYGAVFN